MDPYRNPFAPGAGSPPPELAGREALLEESRVALHRIRHGRAARSLILYGLRGVGKTVLLSSMRKDAEQEGITVIGIEAPESRSLPGVLVPALRAALLRMDRLRRAGNDINRAMRALASFAKLKVTYADITVSLDAEPEPGVADSGDLGNDLTDLLTTIGEVARAQEGAVALAIDALTHISKEQLSALICALFRTAEDHLPVALTGAGAPLVLAQMGEAKSYAERLFRFVPIDALDREAAAQAIIVPIQREEERITTDAVNAIIEATRGYPYFLQEWGKHSWDVAPRSPITSEDVAVAGLAAQAELDVSFFRVRFDQLSPAEKRYLRAMAELGRGPHRSGDIAEMLGVQVTSVAPTRNSLIRKGMLFSPGHGDTAFTVPLFDEFMRRTMELA